MIFFLYTIILLISVVIAYRCLVRKIVVWEPRLALLYRNGKFIRRLKPGVHRFLRVGIAYSIKHVDTRLQLMALSGQELLTSDNVGIKLSMSVTYKVINPEKAEKEVCETQEMIYSRIQLAVRTAIAKRTVENVLEQRQEIEQEVKETVAKDLDSIGVEIQVAGIKDIMFPGDLKKIMHEIIKARKEGQAALEKARAESAVLRNLANASRMLENNPNLMNLKVLQAISEPCGNTYVVGVTQGLFQVQPGKNGKKQEDEQS